MAAEESAACNACFPIVIPQPAGVLLNPSSLPALGPLFTSTLFPASIFFTCDEE